MQKNVINRYGNPWQGFVRGNRTLTEEILINDAELSRIEAEIREMRELLDES